jgi:nucleoside phosphorylase
MLLVVGIAGAVPDGEFTLGDVVVATRLHDFSVGAALEGEGRQVTNQGGPMHKGVQDVLALLPALKEHLGDWNSPEEIGMDRPQVTLDSNSVYGTPEWRTKLTASLQAHFGAGTTARRPVVTARSVASGNLLVKDTKTLEDWRNGARELAAVEMELNGVYTAARRRDREYPILAIRGISDVVGLQRDPNWTRYACEVAASCALALIRSEILRPSSENVKAAESTAHVVDRPRRLTNGVQQALLRELVRLEPHEYEIEHNSDDADGRLFAHQLSEVLASANWTCLSFAAAMFPSRLLGIRITYPVKSPSVMTLIASLTRTGFQIRETLNHDMRFVHILVGYRG